MKKTLLILTTLLCAYAVNAQTHVATPVKTKKAVNVAHHSFTPKPTAACDTLKLDSSANWSAFYYTYGTKGYVFGVSNLNSSQGNLFNGEDANYYDVSGSDYNYITGGLASFAVANSNVVANLDKDLVFKVYEDDGTGVPGNLLGSTTLKLSQVHADVNDSLYTEFIFATPIAIPSNKIFYVAIDHSNFSWGNGTRDSIAITADSSDQAPAAAYQYFTVDQGSIWLPVNQFWTSGGVPLNANLFLFPYVSNSLIGCSTLPVSILNFKGSIKNNQALLSWNTATELNNKGFEIERSKDGKTFSGIGFVNGAGTTTQVKNYTYTDVTLSDLGVATSYYRLKQIDVDGKASYSNVIPLSLKDILSWKLYPNPVKDKFTVELNLTADANITVQIISKDGRLLLNADKGMLPQGQQQLTFNIQNIASGSYFVRVKAGDKSYTQNIVKQ